MSSGLGPDAIDRRRLVTAVPAVILFGMAACGRASVPGAAMPSAQPRRIVSLNPCIDVILVRVADHDRIAALSHYSRDAYQSTIAEAARTLPTTFETAEEIIALRPDLVLTGRNISQSTRDALARLGIPVVLFDVPETVSASLAQVRQVARLIGQPERGEAEVTRIETAMAAASPPSGSRTVSALVFMPGGFASGPGTLMDEMMRRAGLTNAVIRYGLRRSVSVPLEQVIADPPELLLSGAPYPGAPSWAERVMEHPALNGVSDRMQRAIFPEKLLFCGGPVLIETARTLAKARDLALARHASERHA
ncbi:ABC transporter substrate-binding protein [soil metagenome]